VKPNSRVPVKESQRKKKSLPGTFRHPRRLRGSLMRKRLSLSMRKGSPLKAKKKSGGNSVLNWRKISKKELD
jgi:hypothetical protein